MRKFIQEGCSHIRKFVQENRNIVIITAISTTVCIFISIFKSSRTLNALYWMYPWGELCYWISISIISATIFFIFQTYIPSQKEEYLKRPSVAITYRKLQLMLVRLDDLVCVPYQKIKSIAEIDMDVDHFFKSENLVGVFDEFDLSQDSPYLCKISPQKYISFKDYFISQWEEVKSFAKDALLTPYAQTAPELSYQLEYLLSESSFDRVFKSLAKGYLIDYSCILSLNQPDTKFCKNDLENIVAFHKIAFSLYDILKEDSRLKNIYKPPFYNDHQ